MDYSILTDIGSRRETNQDYAGTYENRAGLRILLLADGMGGHKAGNVASKLAVEDLGKLWTENFFDTETDKETIESWLRSSVRKENENIANLGKLDEYKGMGTTLEAIVLQGSTVISAHVGDSRTYLLRDGEMRKITTDHSLVQELVDAGQITEEEAENHPNKNIITRSLGQTAEVHPDVFDFELHENDYLLINSDGLTNMVSEQEIQEVIETAEASLDEKTAELVRLANHYGGADNITVIVAKFDGHEGELTADFNEESEDTE